MKITQVALATLFVGFGVVNAMQQQSYKIRCGSARVRVTLVNNTEHAYTAEGWYAGTRGQKESRDESAKKAVKPVTFEAREQLGRFHMTFGKKSIPQTETQEVTFTSQGHATLSFVNTIDVIAEGLKYTGTLQGAGLKEPKTVSFIVAKPADTAAEIEIKLTLAGTNLELSLLEKGQKPVNKAPKQKKK